MFLDPNVVSPHSDNWNEEVTTQPMAISKIFGPILGPNVSKPLRSLNPRQLSIPSPGSATDQQLAALESM